MQEWGRHKIALRNPPTERMRDVHKLHITQSVPILDENSALRPNMPQRDDDEGGKPKRLSFSPASSVWGQMGRAWTSGDRNARTTELVTASDYVAFFHQFLGLTNNPELAQFANVQWMPEVLYGWCGWMGPHQYMPYSFFQLDSSAQSRHDGAREHLQ
jgi:hypothetical protein